MVLLLEYNTLLKETQGKILLRIYTSQRIMANKTNIYVSHKNIIQRWLIDNKGKLFPGWIRVKNFNYFN